MHGNEIQTVTNYLFNAKYPSICLLKYPLGVSVISHAYKRYKSTINCIFISFHNCKRIHFESLLFVFAHEDNPLYITCPLCGAVAFVLITMLRIDRNIFSMFILQLHPNCKMPGHQQPL